MKALVLEEYNKLVFKDVPDPEIHSNEVLVKVKACGICGQHIIPPALYIIQYSI
jgi:L-iditol 2-dehydrogenase